MQKFKIAGLTVIGAIALTVLLSMPTVSFAQDSNGEGPSNFIEALAEKLGLTTDEVETAFEEVRQEQREERQSEMETKIQDAVVNGDLTARQAEILDAMHEIRSSQEPREFGAERTDEDRENFRNMSEEERQAQMEEIKETKTQELVDSLNELGLNVTAEELEELRNTMQELGFGGQKRPSESNGQRGGMGGFRK